MITISNRPIPQEIMILEWARAETKRLVDNRFISQELADRSDSQTNLAVDDSQALINAICGHRGGFFGHFITNSTIWYEATCPMEEVGQPHLCKYFESVHRVDGVVRNFRNVAELAEGDPSFCVQGKFERTAMRGRPTLVSSSRTGPLFVLEGTHRLVEIYRAARAGTAEREAVNLIVGISASVRNWNAWRDPFA